MDLAYVDKLANDNNDVKYLLVHQDLFDRTVDAKGMKTKNSEETVRAFLTMITKRNGATKIRFDKGTDFAGEPNKLWKAEGIQFYSAMSETKAAFAERTLRPLIKNFTVKWKIMITSLYTNCLNSSKPEFHKKLLDRLDTNNCQELRLSAILYSKPQPEKNRSLVLETDFASPRMTYFSRKFLSHSCFSKILKLLQFLPEEKLHFTQ